MLNRALCNNRFAREMYGRYRLGLTTLVLASSLFSLLVGAAILARQVNNERGAVAARLELNARLHLIETVFELMNGAETAQRGYLLTQRTSYLSPYKRAVSELPGVLERLTAASTRDPQVAPGIQRLTQLVRLKLDELAETIYLHDEGNHRAAIALVKSDIGQTYMDNFRHEVNMIENDLGSRRDAFSTTALRANLKVRIWLAWTVVALVTSIILAAIQMRGLVRGLAMSEERFRAMAEHSQDIITMTDSQGQWTYVSPAVKHVLGYEPQELVGKYRAHFVHPDDEAHLMKQVHANAEVVTGDVRTRHKDGHYVFTEVIARRITKDHNVVWITNSRDVSERKRVEQIKNDFISNVSHELRTPLTSMVGSLGLAISGKAGAMDASVHRVLDIAKNNCDRLSKLVNDILDFEKVSSGSIQFEMSSHSVDQLVARALTANAPYAEKYKVTLRARHKVPGTHIAVDGDRFDQIMANLLSNAAKFSHIGAEIEVDASVVHGRCRISVVDHGSGIPERFQKNLFERFTQADTSSDRRRGGTGLGLAIAKQMTERMGGTIGFESKEGIGTTFYLEFSASDESALEKCA